ncbi:hypothetical protein AQUCO_10400006v1 [Aquilegia coerulea]|uniref:(+)-delta-cadinene synthase n=1 Tax=Aquilegia coerulea TaxID=218851 RepID=A0A2G5C3P9_AQUCA|nr:hypothetical protein AQUCO_10400006v1 [Aquilegia coerulea]
MEFLSHCLHTVHHLFVIRKMAASTSCFMPMLSVFGNLPSPRSARDPILFGNLPSSRSAINPPTLKNAALTKCSSNASSDAKAEVIRHFHPSVWTGHDFISTSKTHPIDEERLETLKKKVKSMLSLASVDSFQELDLIDKIQRLGVAYHFEDEIEDVLQRTYNDDYTNFFAQNVIGKDEHADLCYVSLRFRLLRQAGYYVSTDVFKKFKNEEGEFHANLASDVQGMLSLYEASYLGFRGEDIMDEAMNYSTKHLNSMLASISSLKASQIQHALTMPLQRSVQRLYARYYIPIYQQDISRNETLLDFAKLDYNFVQLLHQKEMNEIQTWWECLNIRSNVQFDVRDRVVEAYAITNNVNFEPNFSQGRIHLAKLWTMLTVIDDAYDVYGNVNDFEPLCDAIQSWDANSASKLSETMKVVFLEELKFFNEVEADMMKQGNLVGVPYLKEEMQVHTKRLFKEAKIIFSGDMPTFEEWLSLSAPIVVCSLFLIIATMNLGELATKEVFDWIASMPKIIKYCNLIIRLMGDIVSLKVEQARGTNVSCVPCYMMNYGVSESEAIESFQKVITSLWKVMNEEGLRVHPVPMKVINCLLNFNRTIALYYNGVDGHSVSDGRTKQFITSLFIDPIPI